MQTLPFSSATFGGYCLGLGLSWTSPALPRISGDACYVFNGTVGPDCYFQPGEDGHPMPLTDDQASWVGGLLAIGALVSAFVTGFLMPMIGRKWTMMVMCVPSLAGWILLVITGPAELDNPGWFYAGRLLTGICYFV